VSDGPLGDELIVQRDTALGEAFVGSPDRSAIPLTGSDGLDRYTRRDLRKQEQAIAREFHGGPMWYYVVAAWGGFALWLSLFPLTMLHLVPLWAAFIVSSVLATGGYVTSHEAMHSNIRRPGTKDYWINEWVGQVSTIPIVFPFSMARLMHLEHHYHCNDPQKDPDYSDEAPNALMAWYKTWYNRQPAVDGSIHAYKRILAEMGTPIAARSLRETMWLQLVFMAVLFGMAWSGYAIEAALVWWLPRHIGLSYIRFYLSWAPHHPRAGRTGRYENTHVFKSRLGHVLSMGMETHLVHHLYPQIPNHRTKAAFMALKPVLVQRGVDVTVM
jgi:beta-carotene hydroxylase